jgi:hypothetical protein
MLTGGGAKIRLLDPAQYSRAYFVKNPKEWVKAAFGPAQIRFKFLRAIPLLGSGHCN